MGLNVFLMVGRFVRQTAAELRKTVTPTGRDLACWTAGVSVFVLTLMLMVTGMDLGLGGLVLLVFG
ncbi:preprotein translocase subunit SecE [Bifidobacterium breve]|uniref:preprotein translocase subunit SecE n=1 Tax=Bifidobacterium breve TaxID=1685 RepID=UPI0026A4BBAF